MVAKKKTPDTIEVCEGGCLHITLSGELDISTLKPILVEADMLIAQMREEEKPVKMFVDATRLEGIKLDSRKHGVQWLKKGHCDRIAVHGSSMFIKYFVKMLVSVIGNNMRYYTTKEEAIAWLNEKNV